MNARLFADNNYRDRLMSLIPGEAIVAYTTIGGIAHSFPSDRFYILLFSTLILLMLLPMYIWFYIGIKDKKYILVVAISFIIWATNIDTPLDSYLWFEAWFGSVVLVLWTFAMPIFGIYESNNK